MSLDKMLQQLDKVKKTGERKWLACCPAHEDRTPSLAIQEVEDGRIIIHCFAQCGGAEILDALGMNFSDLFPKKPIKGHSAKSIPKPWSASDVLRALPQEVLVVCQCAQQLLNGGALLLQDHDRLRLARSRLLGGYDVCRHV
jgi:hypothetical protein